MKKLWEDIGKISPLRPPKRRDKKVLIDVNDDLTATYEFLPDYPALSDSRLYEGSWVANHPDDPNAREGRDGFYYKADPVNKKRRYHCLHHMEDVLREGEDEGYDLFTAMWDHENGH